MPHKHRRNRVKSDPSYWDLAPGKNVHPLPVAKAPKTGSLPSKSLPNDDTPRAFTRLLQPYRPPRSSLDDGTRLPKKRKLTTTTSLDAAAPYRSKDIAQTNQTLRIQPHEPLSHFSVRVNAALPFSTLTKSNSHNDPLLKGIGKGRQTKTEKKMQKMQQQWREDDRRRKERMTTEGEKGDGIVDEEGVEEMGVQESEWPAKRKGKRKRNDLGEKDTWKGVEMNRKHQEDERDARGLVGLHDVVQAPPRLQGASKGKMRTRVKLGKGGMKKQAELEGARQSVVERYRAMKKKKSPAV